MPESPIIVWFRQDLRIADNPALRAAADSGAPVVALYVLDGDVTSGRPLGGASSWWLAGSLQALADELARLGVPLTLRRGAATDVLPALADEIGAGAVYWNRCYAPATIARDTEIKAVLKDADVAVESHNAALLHEPWTIKTKKGGHYKVYSRFRDSCLAAGDPMPPHAAPETLRGPDQPIDSDDLADWNLTPTRPDWAGGLRETWMPGSAGAVARLERFLDEAVEGYAARRDIPSVPGTSGLSPHLHFGEIGPRQVWQTVTTTAAPDDGRRVFLSEVLWREFAYHVLYHVPDLATAPINRRFIAFPWEDDADALAAWQQGRTGYPIVDAGMRELWHTGVMHNRVRMVAASFLIKHLMQPWQAGEQWFWDTLVDADLAANAFNWQWIAGCGADAAPYFRIFNPITQGERFDPDGDYVRRWVPELAKLPAKAIHAPWRAKPMELATAGVTLGETYPEPIVDHKFARERALAAFKALPKAS